MLDSNSTSVYVTRKSATSRSGSLIGEFTDFYSSHTEIIFPRFLASSLPKIESRHSDIISTSVLFLNTMESINSSSLDDPLVTSTLIRPTRALSLSSFPVTTPAVQYTRAPIEAAREQGIVDFNFYYRRQWAIPSVDRPSVCMSYDFNPAAFKT